MIHFDAFCRAAEVLELSPLQSLLRRASLFDFSGQKIPESIADDRRDWLAETFFLPLNPLAICDSTSCILIEDIEQDSHGLTPMRRYCECLCAAGKPGIPDGLTIITMGEACSGWAAGKSALDMRGRLVGVGVLQGDVVREPFHRPSPDEEQGYLAPALTNLAEAYQQIMVLNSPDRFILETTPRGARPANAPKIPRSHERPQYTLLHPQEIRQRMGLPEPEAEPGRHASPRPHERRAHVRTYRSDRYIEMRGKSVVIPASWVGPSENAVQGKRYRVILDK